MDQTGVQIDLLGQTSGETGAGFGTTVVDQLVSTQGLPDPGTQFKVGETVTITESGLNGVATATVLTVT